MPYNHILNTGQRVETNLVTSLLVALQLNHVQIENVCGGRAKCGKCVIKVLKGEKYLSPKKEAEIRKLRSIKDSENMRLACQTYTRGDIEIDIVNIKI